MKQGQGKTVLGRALFYLPRLFSTAGLSSLFFTAIADAKPDISALETTPIIIEAQPINFDNNDPGRKIFGKLKWRGGLLLQSSSPYFGGYSGLTIDPAGKRLIAVSDGGSWLMADIHYEGLYPKSLQKAQIGPLRDRKGKRFRTDLDSDSEAIELIDPHQFKKGALISFERRHRITHFKVDSSGLHPWQRLIRLPKGAKKLKRNKGLEALTLIRSGALKGALVIFAERAKDSRGNLRGWLIHKSKIKPLALVRLKGFDLTGLAALPGGDLILLERRFRYDEGIQMRIRRIRQKELRGRKKISGEVLLEATGHYNIDNMEGIAAHRSAKGETILTLISDDNFSGLQRTLLMQFALPKKKPHIKEENNTKPGGE